MWSRLPHIFQANSLHAAEILLASTRFASDLVHITSSPQVDILRELYLLQGRFSDMLIITVLQLLFHAAWASGFLDSKGIVILSASIEGKATSPTWSFSQYFWYLIFFAEVLKKEKEAGATDRGTRFLYFSDMSSKLKPSTRALLPVNNDRIPL